MTAWECLDCTTVYTVGAPACPHCRSTGHREQGSQPATPEPATPVEPTPRKGRKTTQD